MKWGFAFTWVSVATGENDGMALAHAGDPEALLVLADAFPTAVGVDQSPTSDAIHTGTAHVASELDRIPDGDMW